MVKDTIESRALKIAARIMVADGLCRYDTPTKCHRLTTDETTCETCIRRWIVNKAKKELKSEAKTITKTEEGYE